MSFILSDHKNSKRVQVISFQESDLDKLIFPFKKHSLTSLEYKPFSRFSLAQSLDEVFENKLSKTLVEILKNRSTGTVIVKPEITDKKFDELIRENNYLEKKYPNLILKKNPNDKVGGTVSKKFEKSNHKQPMLSLANAFNKNDLLDFVSRITKFLNFKTFTKIDYVCEPKIDGLSINLYYQNGKLIKASTRGG